MVAACICRFVPEKSEFLDFCGGRFGRFNNARQDSDL
jgi:hypothetical protein